MLRTFSSATAVVEYRLPKACHNLKATMWGKLRVIVTCFSSRHSDSGHGESGPDVSDPAVGKCAQWRAA